MIKAAVLQWTIPDIQLSREPDCSCQQLDFGSSHVACPWDFCQRCGADLRVARLLVTSVSCADLWRLQLGEIAACCGVGDLAECIKLGISYDERLKLADLFYEGLGPAVEYVICGFDSVDLVGITADGTFLYAQRGSTKSAPNRTFDIA
jgi:hypothetical protein